MDLKIALLQLLPGKGLDAQLQIGKSACERAKAMGADIALFQEMWSSGYVIPQEEREAEGIYMAEIPLDLLRDYRSHEVMGWRYRRPEVYGLIVSEENEVQKRCRKS